MTELWCGCCPRGQVVRRNRRKNQLVGKILKMRGHGDSGHPGSWSRLSAAARVLLSLDERQLGALFVRVQVGGGGCVVAHLEPDEVAVLGRAFRWNEDIPDGGFIKSVPLICVEPGSCVNPFHLSRPVEGGANINAADPSEDSLPPPPYSETTSPSVAKETYQCSSSSSSADLFSSRDGQDVTWCKLAYWEESRRVGDLKSVSRPVINISGMPALINRPSPRVSKHRRRFLKPSEDVNVSDIRSNDLNEEWSMSLPSIFSQNENPSDSVLKIREKVGKGVILEKSNNRGDEVWLYNVSTVPVFVSSTTLEAPSCRSHPFSVHKLLPGSHIKVFDYTDCQQLFRQFRSAGQGPIDPYALQISFGKGWGANYSRQDVMSCPSWLEVYLVPPSRRNPVQAKVKNSQS